MEKIDATVFEGLLTQFGKRKHPLDYQNRYQLMVMVLLSARDSDRHINEIAPNIFKACPSMAELAQTSADELMAYIGTVKGASNKAVWLAELARMIKQDIAIPHKLDELIKFPGIGRKSANVIIRESGDQAEGVVVDLHVVRVAPRIGIAHGDKPEKIEKELMALFPKERWNEAGMALSFLGREICRPTNPKCSVCPISDVCAYYQSIKKS